MKYQTKNTVRAGTAVKWFVALIVAFFQVYPLVYTCLSGLRTQAEFQTLPPYAFPRSLYLSNYHYRIQYSLVLFEQPDYYDGGHYSGAYTFVYGGLCYCQNAV